MYREKREGQKKMKKMNDSMRERKNVSSERKLTKSSET